MAKVTIANASFRVQLNKLEAFRAGRSSLVLESWRIRSITVVGPEQRSELGKQEVGAGSCTGTFLQRGGRIFAYWPRKTSAVRIELIDPTYAAVVIGSASASSLVARLKAELKGQ